jgi:Topoisomerase 6 subunit A/Spo11, Toprim domain
MSFSAADILDVTKSVTKEWTQQRKAEERGRRSRYSREYVYSDRVDFTEVAADILPGAYRHASGDGRYSVSKRQLFYACREQFREKTGRQLEYGYFAGTLLVQFRNRHPAQTAAWKITADPRGTLTLPNARHEVRIPVGTIEIDDHLRKARRPCDPFEIDAEIAPEWPSLAPGQRYQAVLYVEKEGFGPILEEARIAERFDIAVMSCKGQSVVAARKFVDEVCARGRNVPLFVVHDFDKAGFEISQRLTTVSDWAEENDRVTYQFRNDIHVVDLGLRLTDVNEYGLSGEACEFKGHFASDSIATEEEKEYLLGNRRVELNEFTSPQFVEWLETKLREHLPRRLVPDDQTLEAAYRRSLVVAKINGILEEAVEEAVEYARRAPLPKNLRAKLAKALKAKDSDAWDRELYRMADAG